MKEEKKNGESGVIEETGKLCLVPPGRWTSKRPRRSAHRSATPNIEDLNVLVEKRKIETGERRVMRSSLHTLLRSAEEWNIRNGRFEGARALGSLRNFLVNDPEVELINPHNVYYAIAFAKLQQPQEEYEQKKKKRR